MNSGHVEVSIFNRSYKLKSTPDEELYLKKLAKYVDEKMMIAYKKNPNFKPSKIAVLTALNLADELLKLKEKEISEPTKVVPQPMPAENPFQDSLLTHKLESLLERLDRSINS